MAFGNTPYYQPQMGYQPMQYPSVYQDRLTQLTQQQFAAPVQQQVTQGRAWVLCEAEANSYPVPNGCEAVLFDRDGQTMYIKATAANGMPDFRKLRYYDITNGMPDSSDIQSEKPASPDVTREEYEKISQQYEQVTNAYNRLSENINVLETEYKRLSEEHNKVIEIVRKMAEKKGVATNAE